MYFTLSMGVPFVRRSYCCSQQLQPTPKGAPFYIAWPILLSQSPFPVPRLWVPHPCVLCKGGYTDYEPLEILICLHIGDWPHISAFLAACTARKSAAPLVAGFDERAPTTTAAKRSHLSTKRSFAPASPPSALRRLGDRDAIHHAISAIEAIPLHLKPKSLRAPQPSVSLKEPFQARLYTAGIL
jgi:hypothetical protein